MYNYKFEVFHSPVVRAIFEEVHNRHCRMREAMNKERLENSLDIMGGMTRTCQIDNWCSFLGWLSGVKHIWK